jgi:O-antigen/teichoic acid export membrane protein
VAQRNQEDPKRQGKKPSADAKATGSFMRPKPLLSGLGWNTIGQLVTIGIPLGFTPFLLHRLGATEYGIFALVSSLRGLLSNLDGGLGPTGSRYFPVYVGRGDKKVTSSFLFTILATTGTIVGAEVIIMILLAPVVAKGFSFGSGFASQAPEMAQLIRLLMPALLVAAIRTHLQRLLMAHHRWAFVNYTQVIGVVAYTATVILVSYQSPGLGCLVWGAYVQEAILLFTALWACRHYVALKDMRPMPGTEVREILRFGWRVQIAAAASSFNYEIDSVLVGLFFPVKDVAYYSIGANFSQQVLNMPTNGLNPIAQEIGRNFGKNGKEGVLCTFADNQRMWVKILGVFPIVAVLEGWFGIRTWLGPGSQIAAITAALLVAGSAPLLYNAIVDVTTKVVGMPEIESWYLGIGVVFNVAFTIVFSFRIGVIGIPLGTAIGQVISYFVCIYLARRKLGKEITPFTRYIRYSPLVAAAAVATVCEWLFRDSLPSGGIGFVASGLLTLPAMVTYYGWVYREFLLRRLGIGSPPVTEQTRVAPATRAERVLQDDGAYARRQLRGLQALMAIAAPGPAVPGPAAERDVAVRQLRGMAVLMALSEPEMSAIPFTGAQMRLRYTGPLYPAFGRPLDSQAYVRLSGRE